MINQLCICCNEPKKYKCPQCEMPYCSAPCFKLHNCKPIQKKPQIQVQEPFKSDYIDEEYKLPKEKLEILKRSSKIRKFVSNKRLQKLLIHIDNSKYRFKELNTCMQNDKDFEEFCTLMLSEMGHIDENGQFK